MVHYVLKTKFDENSIQLYSYVYMYTCIDWPAMHRGRVTIGNRLKRQHFTKSCLRQDYKLIYKSLIKVPQSRRCLSRSIMCESWNICLGWSPGNEVLEREIMLEQIMALMELKKAVIQYIPSQNLSSSNPLGKVWRLPQPACSKIHR